MKQKGPARKGLTEKAAAAPKELACRGLDDGTERLRGQVRNDRGQERPQDYGSEKIEGGAQRGAALAGRSVEAFLKSKKQELERGRVRAEEKDAPAADVEPKPQEYAESPASDSSASTNRPTENAWPADRSDDFTPAQENRRYSEARERFAEGPQIKEKTSDLSQGSSIKEREANTPVERGRQRYIRKKAKEVEKPVPARKSDAHPIPDAGDVPTATGHSNAPSINARDPLQPAKLPAEHEPNAKPAAIRTKPEKTNVISERSNVRHPAEKRASPEIKTREQSAGDKAHGGTADRSAIGQGRRLTVQEKREMQNARRIPDGKESIPAPLSAETAAQATLRPIEASVSTSPVIPVEEIKETHFDMSMRVFDPPPTNQGASIPTKTPRFQLRERFVPRTEQAVSSAPSPARQRIKAGAPKIKTSARAAKQPVRALERAQARAIRDAQKTTAAAKTTARTARRAGRVAERTARELVRAILRALKASLEGLRALAATIAGGGGVAFVVVLVICLVALLLATPFGLFLSPEHSDSGSTIQTAITSLNGEFSLVIEQIQEDNPHDVLNMDNDGVAAMTRNWNDVLAIYAVLITTDDTAPGDAATMTPEKLNILRGVFWDMNQISYDVETVEDVDSGDEETTLTITVTTKSKDEIAAEYGFTEEQLELLHELTQSEYEGLFAALAGSDASLILSPAQMQMIMEQMGGSVGATRRQVVMTAYQLKGKCNYFWGGKSLVLGWDSRWGTPKIVSAAGSSTTGTMRPYGLDCSGFVDWVFYNVTNGEYVIGHGGGASAQHSWCDPITWAEAMPGDLAFYPGDSHVGIICGYDEAGTVQIIHCAYSANNVVVTGKSGFTTVGRPKFYS